jgi:hypothetical protein
MILGMSATVIRSCSLPELGLEVHTGMQSSRLPSNCSRSCRRTNGRSSFCNLPVMVPLAKQTPTTDFGGRLRIDYQRSGDFTRYSELNDPTFTNVAGWNRSERN